MTLSIGENLSKSFEFAKDGLVGHWVRWILLSIISAISIVNLIASGYVVKIYQGGEVAPELEGYVKMFIDGLKLTIIGLVYVIIPIIIIQAAELFRLDEIPTTFGDAMLTVGEYSTTGWVLVVVGTILALIAGMFALIAGVRFAKTESMKEAFNFSAIREKIEEIGWSHYILSYIAIIIIFGLIVGILGGPAVMFLVSGGMLSGIGVVLLLVLLILMPFLLIWQGKFYENLYSLA